MKLVINPATAPKIRSLVILHIAKNAINVGTVMIIAIKEPLAAISVMVNFFTGGSDNIFR